MSSHPPRAISDEEPVADRRAWLRPAFARLETGEAEAQDGTGTDANDLLS